MKVLIRKLAARLQRLSPFAITTIGLCCLAPVGAIDFLTVDQMSSILLYMLVVVLVGWGAGRWHAVFVAGVAALTLTSISWSLSRGASMSGWVILWNLSTRFLVFSIGGWLTAEVTRLTRNLGRLVEERTAQWKAEVEQHKATSIRLGEALDRFEQVINNINEVFWLSDVAKTEVAYISPGYEKTWGRKCEELYREPGSWSAAVHPADRNEVLRRAQTDQADGHYDIEYRILRPDGSLRWIRDRAFPVRNARGEVYRIAGLAEDITERKQTREMLQTQAAILESMAEGVVVTDEAGLIVQMNPAAERIWGYGRKEVIGQPASVFSALPEPEATALLWEVLAALNTTGAWRGTFKNRRKDGAIILCEAVISRLEIQGRVLMVAVEQEVTERQRTEQALRQSEERYRALAEASPDAIFILDRHIKVQYVNSSASALWRRRPEELIGLTQSELFPPEVAQHHCRFVEEVLETGKPVRREEALAFPTGEQWIEVRLVPLYGEQDTVHSVMGVCRDFTERKRAERQLAEALDLNQKMIAASTTGIAVYCASGECVFANEALARTVGGSVREVLQGNFRTLESWRKSGLLQMANEALSQGKARRGEFYAATRFGKNIWVDCQTAPFVSNGQPHLLLMTQDITQRKYADSLLQAQRDLGVGLSLTSDLDTALRHFLSIAVKLGGLDCGGIYLVKEPSQELELAAHLGLSPSFAKAVAHYPADSPHVKLLRQGQGVFDTVANLPIPHSVTELQEGLRAIAFIPLFAEQKIVGALNLASHTTDEIPAQTRITIEAIASQAAGAIARIRAETDRHRLEHQILKISDREHARIGQDVHDGLCQNLVSLAFDANALQRELAARRRAEAKLARRIADNLDQAITEARQLSRGLFPVRLEREGLPPALEELARATRDRFKIRCCFDSAGPVAVEDNSVATHLYRIAQEAVANAAKHSQARTVSIRLHAGADQIELRVEDDGTGISSAARSDSSGMGMHIMDYRARSIGGTLHVGAGQRGGTVVSCCAPLVNR